MILTFAQFSVRQLDMREICPVVRSKKIRLREIDLISDDVTTSFLDFLYFDRMDWESAIK